VDHTQGTLTAKLLDCYRTGQVFIKMLFAC
jgi:hypothetical protein